MEDNKTSTKRNRHFQDPVNAEDVEVIIKRALGSTVKILNHHVRIFSEEKLGFMGSYRHLVVTIQRQGNIENEIVTFFLKSIPHDVEEQALLIEESNAFYKEISFYKQMVPELMSVIKDKSWIAQCYLVKDDVMAFEDLNIRNFKLRDKHLDAPALKAALTGLAKLHASSILAERRLGKTFGELYPELFKESLFVREGRFYNWFRTNVDVIAAVAERLGLDHKCIRKVCNQIFKIISPSTKWQNVITHGDVKSYNFLFDDSKPIPKCVVVDFQLIRYVPQMVDVAQLLYLNTRKGFRENNEEELLKYYYGVFCETLVENDEKINVLSFKELVEEYEEVRVFGLVSTACSSPLNLMEGKMCEELTKDSDGFAKLMFEDHVDVVLDYMRQDSMYRDIIIDITTEIVQRSKELLRF